MEDDQQEVIDLGIDEKCSLLCPFCDQLFKNVMAYNVHVKNHSDDNSSDKGQAETILPRGEASDNDIDILDKMEMNSPYLGAVQKSQKGGTNWSFRPKCPVCNSGRVTYQDLLVHLVTIHYKEKINQHHDKTQLKCQICEKKFRAYNELVRHLLSEKHKILNEIVPKEMVESLKQIKADIQKQKPENVKKNLKRGRKLVLNEIVPKEQVESPKQIKADFCKKELENELKNIRRSSESVLNEIVPKEQVESLKQIKAVLCKKKLKNVKKNIRMRRKLVLNEIVPKVGKNLSFKCPVCSLGKVTNQDLCVHLVRNHYKEKLNQHSDKTQRKCKVCEQQFGNYFQLVRHLVSGKHNVLNEIVPKEMVESLKQIKADIYKKKIENSKKNRRRRKLFLNEIVPKVKSESLQQIKADFCMEKLENELKNIRRRSESVLNEIVPKEQVESLKQIKADFCKKELENDTKNIRRSSESALNESVPKEKVESLKQIKIDFYTKELENEMKNIRSRRKSLLNTEICLKQGEEDEKEVSSMIESPNIIYPSGNKQSPIFKCPICKSKTRGFHHLKVHIGSAHYKDEVKKLENKDTRGCNLCQKTFKVHYHLRSHVVLNHQFVSQVFPYDLLKKLEDMKKNSGKLYSI